MFKLFMDHMKPFMKSRGFSKKNSNFYKRHPEGNIGIINFQKDRSGSCFTININNYSRVLDAAFSYNGETQKYPSHADGHLRVTITPLIPRESDEYRNLSNSKNIDILPGRKWNGGALWWKLYVNPKEVFDEVSPLVEKFAIPRIDQYMTDEQLKNVYLKCPDTWDLMYLATFFQASGEEEKLQDILNKLGKDVRDNPQYTGIKEKYDTFVRERKWIGDAEIERIRQAREMEKLKKELRIKKKMEKMKEAEKVEVKKIEK